jgi:radical SAM protein with 4Fe4S-binding SPASM domain
MTIAVQSQERFGAELAAKLAGVRFPVSGTVELTDACNFRCGHCYLPAERPAAPPLDAEEMSRLMDEMADAGCLSLTFTGGEPLTRRDFREIWSAAAARGFILTLFTNGSLVDEETADFLAAHPPRCVEVSLYGASRRAYREVTGVPSGFDSTLRGVDLLRERGVEVLLKALLVARLGPEVDGMRALAEERGLKLRLSPGVNPTLDGDLRPLEARIDPVLGARLELPLENRALLGRLWRHDRAVAESRRTDGTGLVCGAGRTAFNVDPLGRLTPCLMLREPGIDLRASGFVAAWEALSLPARTPFEPCGSCDLRHLCGACPGLMESGASPAPSEDDYHCVVARERAALIRLAAGEAGGEVR